MHLPIFMISLLNSQMWKEKEDKMKDEVGSESDASFLFPRKLHEYKEHDSTVRSSRFPATKRYLYFDYTFSPAMNKCLYATYSIEAICYRYIFHT